MTFDADGQHDPADIPALVAPILTGECDVTLGSRFRGRAERMPLGRRVMLRAAVWFTWLTSSLRVSDTHNGLRAFSRSGAADPHHHGRHGARVGDSGGDLRPQAPLAGGPGDGSVLRLQSGQGPALERQLPDRGAGPDREAPPRTLFQLITFPIALAVGLRSAFRLLRGERPRLRGVLATLLWIAAAITILIPNATTEIANRLGIGRGTDLVTYLVALAFLWSWFYFHQKITRTARHVTDLSRALAVERALQQYPPFPPTPPKSSGPDLVD